MDPNAESIIEAFYKISGETVREKYSNFYKILNENHFLKNHPTTLDYITSQLIPSSHIQRIFRTDFLIYFHCFKDLYLDFQKGDDITLSKLSKQEWFYETAFTQIGAVNLIEKLPEMSYSLKVKFLRRIPISEETADGIFEAVLERYGIFFATILLPKCTEDKIRTTLLKYPIKLTTNELKTIYNKDPDLICVYLEERVKHERETNFMNKHPILIFIAQKNPEMFSILFKKYKFELTLGHRTTKNYIKAQRTEVLCKIKQFMGILNSEVAVRNLGSHLKFILFENDKNSEPFWIKLLKFYPKNQQFEVFHSVYNINHYKKFDSSVVTEKTLELVPLVNRCDYAKILLEKTGDLKFLEFVAPEYFTRVFKQKINYLGVYGRANHISYGLKCCVNNKDLNTLLNILNMICYRLKNDDEKIRFSCYNVIDSNPDILDKFTESHWEALYNIMEISKTQGEWIGCLSVVFQKHAIYLVKNKKSLRKLCSADPDLFYHIFELRFKYPDVYKAVLLEFLEIGHSKPENSLDAAKYDCSIIAGCKLYNEKHKPKINIWSHKRIFESVKNVLSDETCTYIDYWTKTGIEYFICQKSEDLEELKKLYFGKLNLFDEITGLLWFLKHEPRILAENFNTFLENFSKFNTERAQVWRLVKKYNNLGLDKDTIEFCKNKLKEAEFSNVFEVRKFVKVFAILAPSETYLNFLNSIDTKTKNLELVQSQLLQFAHYTSCPETLLPVALKFAQNDHLRDSLAPLYSCFYKIPEDEARVFFKKLVDKYPFALRKHVVYLGCVISDFISACSFIQAVPGCEVGAMKFFAKNPVERVWLIIEAKIQKLTESELEILKLMLNVGVPHGYKDRFFRCVWKVLSDFENVEIKKYMISGIDRSFVLEFDPEFALKLIKEFAFTDESTNSSVANLLIFVKSEKKFNLIEEILIQFKSNRWNSEKRTARKVLLKFVETLFLNFMQAENTDQNFGKEFSVIFNKVFKFSEAFDENILILSMSLKNQSIEDSAKFITDLKYTVTTECNIMGVIFLSELLKNQVLPQIFKTNSEIIKLCHHILEIQNFFDDFCLVLKLLPTEVPEKKEDYLLYNNIVKQANEQSSTEVELLLNSFLKK